VDNLCINIPNKHIKPVDKQRYNNLMEDYDDYDLSFLTGDQDLVHCAICAKQGISKPSVGIAKASLPKCRDCYLL